MPWPSKTQAVYLLCTLLVLSILSGCVNLSDRWDMQAYTVSRGDTLYSIAWRYEKDFRELAEWNDIQPPYSIYPGQRLVMQPANKDGTTTQEDRPQILLDSTTGESIAEAPARAQQTTGQTDQPSGTPRQVVVKKNDTLYSISRTQGLTHHQLARWNHLRSPYVLKPGQVLRLSPPSTSAPATLSQSRTPVVNTQAISPANIKPVKIIPVKPAAPAENLPTRVSKWYWPVSGRVVKTFKSNDTSRKGIRISGKKGQTVKAAAAGSVVYSGNGLINYGNLVIIKHSHSFLSAYAYNSQLLVKEGESVKPGQAIARIGGPASNSPQLHFEIRRNGKPVNPLHYLPKS